MSVDLADLAALVEGMAIPGPQGDKGDRGEPGDKGERGDAGPRGDKGDKGDKGDPGTNGLQGEQGDRGTDGAIGPMGPQGERGPMGPQGERGFLGEQGVKGDRGDIGPAGPPGKDGAPGATGPGRSGSGSATLQVLDHGVPVASQVRGLDIEGDATVAVQGSVATIEVSAAGGDLHDVFEQSTPASVWTIAHGLGKWPSVSVVTSAGDLVEGDVLYVDINTVQLSFGAPFSGSAFLN